MTKNLTESSIARQNILNNRFAIEEIQSKLHIDGMLFEGEYRYTKKMVAEFYGVDISTIDRHLASNGDELKHNGYVLCKGKSLKEFKLQFAHLINEASKTTQLGLFNFRAFLNIGMLLTESERAKTLRSMILDLVIDAIHKKTGGGLKGIRDNGGINATLNFIQNDTYYPSFADKLTYLVFSFCSGHFFHDGNKRIALTLGVYFLHINGYNWEACVFMSRFEAFVYHIAASRIDQGLFKRIIMCFLEGVEYDESLKLDIACAIDK